MDAYHMDHFAGAALELFTSQFLHVQPEARCTPEDATYYHDYYYGDEEYEEDDLGYYPDGVKRTLTEEQIAIFRHSELESIRRAEEDAAERAFYAHDPQTPGPDGPLEDSGLPAANKHFQGDSKVVGATEAEDGELDSDPPRHTRTTGGPAPKKKRGKKNRQKAKINAGNESEHPPGWFKTNVKPDLRKRTWDVVETGMDSLDYDGCPEGEDAPGSHVAQRRRISYDD